MISRKHLAGLVGFAFVAAWIGFNFGYAVLCLVGALVFYFVTSFLDGELDLGELQARFSSNQGSGGRTAAPRAPRVQ